MHLARHMVGCLEGVAHALEVAWPDRPIASPEAGGPAGASASPEEDEGDGEDSSPDIDDIDKNL